MTGPRNAMTSESLPGQTLALPADLAQTLAASSTLAAHTLEVGTSPGSPPGGPPALSRGHSIGRYVYLGTLGSGGMGVVLAAYDPGLDRKVALKLLRGHGCDLDGRARLQREAQALAKLGHPNVVAVYDVGLHGEQLFVAMEFVDGPTLREWLCEGPESRPWREVLEVFMAAGRGLAAAHRAGLIHRDFKLDNVMIGEDQRVRVMDFGLARATLSIPDPCASHEDLRQSTGSQFLVDELTAAGTLLGTPAYMAPEQLECEGANALSDQFAFCVALWEALYGERPFPGRTLDELLESMRSQALREPRHGSRAPRWLHTALRRGLSYHPEDRWPSMEVLLDQLSNAPARRRRHALIAAGIVLSLGLRAGYEELQTRDDQLSNTLRAIGLLPCKHPEP